MSRLKQRIHFTEDSAGNDDAGVDVNDDGVCGCDRRGRYCGGGDDGCDFGGVRCGLYCGDACG